jgi:alpha-tubulin suppressor-like RCC1 family protein/subtilisin family serine protease
MKRHIAPLLVVFGFIIALGWINTGRQPGLKSAAVQKAEPAIPQVMNSPQAPVLSQDSEVLANPFDALIAAGKLERREARMFEAQTWEPELRKSLDLGPSVPLRRVSEVYEVPEFPYHRVRVDRVYRTDRQARVVGVTAKDEEAAPITERSHVPLSTALPGELVWETAMVADHVMVQTEAGVTRERLHRALPARTRIRDQITQSGLYLVEVPAKGERSLERAILALGQLKEVVKFAEPDFLMSGADTTPNDPLYAGAPGPQWHLPKIMAPRAWDVIKEPKTPADAESTVVAVVDTGVDYTHPDLFPNMWTNPNEIAANGQDDDSNGKIDDVSGWDFIGQSSVQTTIIQDNNPMDDSGHGTHVAGIIGAVGNNALGVSGVCWGVKILPLRIIKKVGTGTYGTYSTALGALDYIKTLNRNGRVVAVANHSWGGSGYSLAMLNSINNPVAAPDPLPAGITSTFLKDVNQLTVGGSGTEQAKIKIGMTITGTGIPVGTLVTIVNGSAVTLSNYTTAARTNQALTFKSPVRPKPYGVVHVAAAGNSRFNNDRLPTYPASIPSGFVISVGASDENDNVAIWSGTAGSNFGRLTVDLFAPGSNIWSTKLKLGTDSGYGYESRNGTSMAAPQVAGTLALLRMWQPQLTELQARQIVIDQADAVANLNLKCLSSGRLNIAKCVDKLYQPILTGSGGSSSGGGTASQPLSSTMSTLGKVASYGSGFLYVENGEVWAWGTSQYGSLGDGAAERSAIPLKIPGLSEVMMVSAKSGCMALKADGTVWAWGMNNNGQLGNGTRDGLSHPIPQQVPGLTDVTWISVSSYHCVAVKGDGTVWCWGYNEEGELGNGTTTNSFVPVQVTGLTGIVQADAGDLHSAAVKDDGTVWCWGSRASFGGVASGGKTGALGDGVSLGFSTVPVQAIGISSAVYVCADNAYSICLDHLGRMIHWGTGRSFGGATSTPSVYPGWQDIVFVSVGLNTIMAMDSNGVIRGVGGGFQGLLGNGSFVGSTTPTPVILPEDDPAIAFVSGDQGSVAVTINNVYAWGDNTSAQLGTGVDSVKDFPVRLDTPSVPTTSLGSSYLTTWLIQSDGTVWKTGYDTTGPPKPRQFGQHAEVVAMQDQGLMLKADGSLWSFGSNDYGELGNGTKAAGINAAPAPISGLTDIVSFAYAGANSGNYCLAVNSSGTVMSWGRNTYGQLGDGTTGEKLSPTVVSGLTGVTKVAAKDSASLALKSDGTVWAWGRNISGQLGVGDTTDRLVPTQVAGLSNVVEIALNGTNSFARKSNGTVWSWGRAANANIAGPGVSIAGAVQTTPLQVTGIPLIKAISARENSSVQLLAANGTVWSWGNRLLQGRGAASTQNEKLPAQVIGLSSVRALANSNESVHALKEDGTVWAWGRVWGDGTAWSALPLQVLGLRGSSPTLSTLGTTDSSDSWLLSSFSESALLNDSLVADDADPDGDGIENLLEYALGLDPRVKGISGLPTSRVDLLASEAQSESLNSQVQLFSTPTVDLSSGKRYLAYTVNRSDGIRQDIDYIVEVSDDLETWNSGDPHTVKVLDTAEVLEVYSATSLDDAPRQFMRLRIQRK